MPTSREHKERFIAGGGAFALAEDVARMVRYHGAAWLTEAQIDDLVADAIADWRFSRRLARYNRRIAAKAEG